MDPAKERININPCWKFYVGAIIGSKILHATDQFFLSLRVTFLRQRSESLQSRHETNGTYDGVEPESRECETSFLDYLVSCEALQ